MKAKVTQGFPGVPDGAIYPVQFSPGDDVEGDLAKVAIENNWAEEVKDTLAPKLADKPAKGKK